MLTSATLSCMFFMFTTVSYAKSLNYNRHMSSATNLLLTKYKIYAWKHWQHRGAESGCWPSSSHGPSCFSSCHQIPSCGGGTSLIHCGRGTTVKGKGIGALQVCGGSLAVLLGGSLAQTPTAAIAPPLLGLPPEPLVDFLGMSLMHTFLWLCRAEEDTKTCFRHFLHL